MTDDPVGALGVKMLRDEIDRLRHRIAEKQDRIDSMEREIKRLRAALQDILNKWPIINRRDDNKDIWDHIERKLHTALNPKE